MNRRLLGIFVAIGFAVASHAVVGAVLDCNAPTDATDRAICRDPALNPLDRLLNDLIAASDDPDAARHDWRAARATCGDRDCLVALYETHIAAMQSTALQRTASAPEAVEVDDGGLWEAPEPAVQPPAAAEPFDGSVQAPGTAPITPREADVNAPIDPSTLDGVAPAGVGMHAPTAGSERGMNSALLLGLLAAAIVFLSLIVLSALGHVVFYFDGRDFAWSLSPMLAVGVGAIALDILQRGPAHQPVRDAVIMLGAGVVLIGAWKTFRNAIRYNRSVPAGLLVGACKMLLAAFMTFSLFANFARRNSEDYHRNTTKGRRERTIARTSFFLLGLLSVALFNGERVYARKGWNMPAE